MTYATVRHKRAKPPGRPYVKVGRTTAVRNKPARDYGAKKFTKGKSLRPKGKGLNQKIATGKDGPVSASIVKFPMRPQKINSSFKKLFAPFFYVYNKGLSLSWTNSYQNMLDSSPYFGQTDISTMFTQYNNFVVPGQSSYVNQAAVTVKIYLKTLVAEHLLTNQTNDVVHLTMYDVVARRDQYNGSSYITPTGAWTQGDIDASQSSAYQIVGSTPFQTPGFTEYWKIVKITELDLHSGGHHRHKVFVSPKKLISNEVINQIGSNGVIKDLTCFTMVVCHGFPDNSTGTSTVSTAPGKVDMVTKKQYEWQPFGSQRTMISVSDNLPVNATDAIINDLTGASTTVTTA